jgi:integrase
MSAPKGKRCGCRDVNGKPLGSRCPKLRQRHHGTYEAEVRISTGAGRRKLHRGGFATAGDRDAFVVQVGELVRLADGDRAVAADIGDLIWQATRYRGQLPAVADVRQKLALGRGLGDSPTVGEYLETWIAGKRRVRPGTAKSYRGHLDVWLIPHLGRIRLDRLTAGNISGLFAMIGKWNAEIAAAAAEDRQPDLPGDVRKLPRVTGVATQHRIYATLRNALTAAVRQRMIGYNPALGVELEPEQREPREVWSPEQVAVFLRESAGDRLFLAYRLILLCGFRRQDICGMRWAYFDAANAEVRIPRAKTKAGVRTVAIDEISVKLLNAHRRRQAAEKLASYGAYSDGGLVFANEVGAPVRPDYVSSHFDVLSRAAGLPRITLHDGRHTAATMALEAEIDIKIVSAQLGHSTTRITQDLYQHVRRSVAGDAAAKVARLIDPMGGQ